MSAAERFFTHPIGKPLAAAGATLLWGSAFPLIKLSYAHMGIHRDETNAQILFAGYRFTLAGMLILIAMLAMRIEFERNWSSVARAAKVGVFQTVLQYIAFYIGLGFSTGTISSITAGTTSFFQLLVARFMYRDERFTAPKVLGMLAGFAGIMVIYFQGAADEGSFGFGEILLLAAMLFGALGNVISKKQASSVNVFLLTGLQMLLGGLTLLAAGGLRGGWLPFRIDGHSVLLLLYLAVLSSTGFLLWNYLMKYNSVGSVSMYLALIPLFGVMLSAWMLNERLYPTTFLSLLLIVLGIVIVNRVIRPRKVLGKDESTGSRHPPVS
ncbi:EamA family transporter [Cohnella sp. CFH 77786]|uniref:DMT family transporter n=1 Tax=Cohnella sp. CFH 77786 TaxID=2662265 RepID=UPI001C60F736|nr:DMT family transporter [Cohnella sp. CFH 77786]MBW5445399.1 EamA family transporter [Cohnella sp. CFH 77786]